ncbi:protein of unknown function [Taphrina deformans PYCC 5710]|uniref:Uncharacterized protein n=1 Tax=Taphrina deformans (strain PYCC 5710 / ATCC 11124 / CBS 356.35 / IMI 108563 / JCM 9778 / NBRC 8474) TaxID=1097556 RepID=R4XK24_TAPDE|nr:protein of unknown function [Taphrina deformans PYCC 5710]|eukprot:CCG84803.1 protein of unknown function [Taphrina deformans PYCC 5710]
MVQRYLPMESIKSSIGAALESVTGPPSILLITSPDSGSEGHETLDRTIEACVAAGLEVTLATPEGTPVRVLRDEERPTVSLFTVQHTAYPAVLLLAPTPASDDKNNNNNDDEEEEDVNVVEVVRKFHDAEKPVGGIGRGARRVVRAAGVRDSSVAPVSVQDGETVTHVQTVVSFLANLVRWSP